MSQLEKDEQAAVRDALAQTLKSLAFSEEESQLIEELFRKMKGHGPELLQDPQGTSAKVMELLLRLLQGSPEEKEAAKEEILAMPETVPALSSEEESKASKKLEELEKEFEEHRGEIELALDEVETKTNEAVEEEADDEHDTGGSALQVTPDDSDEYRIQPNSPLWNVIMASLLTCTVMGVLVTTLTLGAYIVGLFVTYGLLGAMFCALDADQAFMKCMNHLAAPFKAVKYIAKGLWRMVRGKKDPSAPLPAPVSEKTGVDHVDSKAPSS
ncbi:unnamed protein product [Durusdinium trenchii]|uniref:Uncharacterized protein n=2 Tax=Durusdinium trenchii TaxID=1381693 RepID=A0ABP0J536_9DINO